MPLPASGNSISLDQIHVELGESSGTTVSLGDTDVRNLASDTSGAIGMDQFFGLSNASNIEDLYSTFVYKGDGSTQNIVNGLNLSGDGGLVWIKNRDATDDHVLIDTARGATKVLSTNNQNQESTDTDTITAFNNNGFSLGADVKVNTNTENYVAWAFKKQTGFFDIITYTGNGTSNGALQTISHNLGVSPGFIITKCTSHGSTDWNVYHRSYTSELFNQALNLTDEQFALGDWNPTSSNFTVEHQTYAANKGNNENGRTYVAYVFAHQANDASSPIISCGSYTGNANNTGPSVNLGFEPQWILTKQISGATSNWAIIDNMRGFFPFDEADPRLFSNLTNAEDPFDFISPTATGFNITTSANDYNKNTSPYLYIAIRRGPMAEPTAGTQVFNTGHRGATAATNAGTSYYAGFPVDWAFGRKRTYDGGNTSTQTRHMGEISTFTDQGNSGDVDYYMDNMFGFFNSTQSENTPQSYWMFRRYPKVFDTVGYYGTGSNGHEVKHSLGVVPEMIMIKNITDTEDWDVRHANLSSNGDFGTFGTRLKLNTNAGEASYSSIQTSGVTAAHVTHRLSYNENNASGDKYIMLLFATLAGISKVGTVTVSGATNVDCGFSSGARFVLVKRTDATGNWYLWDSVRGIVSGNDPYLLLDTTDDEVTNTDLIDPLDAGFTLSSNFTNGTYIFLALS